MSDDLPWKALAGTAAGLAATLAMTVFMSRTHGHLRRAHRYPLPPRIITDRILPRRLTHFDNRPFGAVSAYAIGVLTLLCCQQC
jgi:hypothetical protein